MRIPSVPRSILCSSGYKWEAGSLVKTCTVYSPVENKSDTKAMITMIIPVTWGKEIHEVVVKKLLCSFCATNVSVRSCVCCLASRQTQFQLTRGSTMDALQLLRAQAWMLLWHTSTGIWLLDNNRNDTISELPSHSEVEYVLSFVLLPGRGCEIDTCVHIDSVKNISHYIL